MGHTAPVDFVEKTTDDRARAIVAAIGTAAIPQAALVSIPDAGHMVMMEQPAAFNHAVRTWLSQEIHNSRSSF